MEYAVSSLKEAIDICLEKYGYNKCDINIIRTLIKNAIRGNVNYFTRTAGARDYISSNIHNNGIINEIINVTKCNSNNFNEIVEMYIDKFFRKKQKINPIESIREKTNFDKVVQKLRYLSTISSNDQEFMSNAWSTFTNIFSGNDRTITSEEIRYDMIYAALKKAEIYRDNATILKTIDPTSNNLTKMDAIKLVEEYVYSSNIEQLIYIINRNPNLSGILLQNLFDYTYLNKDVKDNKYSLNELDKHLEVSLDLKDRSNIIMELLSNEKIKDYNLEKERVIVNLLKNTLLLNIYTHNKKYLDYDEKKLYAGNINSPKEIIHNRITTNNNIANNLIINGKSTTYEYLINVINNLSDKEKYFLSNIYVLSRSTKENKNKLDNAIYYGTNEQIYVYGLLEKEEFIELLKQKNEIKYNID